MVTILLSSSLLAADKPTPTGLDALPEETVYRELARRGLDSLLEQALRDGNVPEGKRVAYRALASLQRAATQPAVQGAAVVAQLAQSLPAIDDPQLLFAISQLLRQQRIDPEVNTLEYWGEDLKTQGRLRPLAELDAKMLDRGAVLAQQRADQLAKSMSDAADQSRMAAWTEADALASAAAFSRATGSYVLAIALDRNDPNRKQVARAGLAALKQWDTPDSGVQAAVRVRSGKLLLALGDFAGAKRTFATVIEGATTPKPDVGQQYEARYFSAVAELLAGNADAAAKALADLDAWQEKTLAGESAESRDGARAASAMLQSRILAARGEKDAAIATLERLAQSRSDLKPVILERVAALAPTTDDLSKQPTLVLESLARSGQSATDPKQVGRSLAAAEQLLARADALPPETFEQSAAIAGELQEKLGRPIDAARTYLALADRRKSANQTLASAALDRALAALSPRRGDSPDAARLYDAIVATAVAPPFNRADLVYDHAQSLFRQGVYQRAAEAYAAVPPSDPRKSAAALAQAVSLRQRLQAEKLSDADRAALVREVQRIVAPLVGASDRDVAVRATLLSADLQRNVLHDPARALALLAGVEEKSNGLPAAPQLLGEALLLRAGALSDQGKTAEATAEILRYLQTQPPDRAADTARALLPRLDADLETARDANDPPRLRALARSRAELSGYLADWAAKNSPATPEGRRDAYRYQLFDAASTHLAAQVEDDPAKRKAQLATALKKYQALSANPLGADDPLVSFGLASVAFDVEDYRTAAERFARLLADRKLGAARVQRPDGTDQDNDTYWEATYKLLASNAALADRNQVPADVKTETANHLKRLFIQWGDQTGGRRWRDAFESLRRKLAPDFVVPRS